MAVLDALTALLEPTVSGLGYELLGVERQPTAGGTLIRLYIDSSEGIVVDDCATVSRQVGDVLEVEEAVSGAYTLEVSSPGLDRPLFTPAQYRVFIGSHVKVRLRTIVNGRRRLAGLLAAATDEYLTISIGEDDIDVPYNVVERARLDPQW
ncbi:MAG: ribosome maturation factor RimP [Proteobacteria bacterium]|nr:ribosome maturation factor RimP [Pseudomonadota bacterium]